MGQKPLTPGIGPGEYETQQHKGAATMYKTIKAILSSKKTLDNRQGRFLTVYLDNGQRKNGKVLVPGYFSSKVQLAYGPVVKIKNSAIRLVAADHAIVKLR